MGEHLPRAYRSRTQSSRKRLASATYQNSQGENWSLKTDSLPNSLLMLSRLTFLLEKYRLVREMPGFAYREGSGGLFLLEDVDGEGVGGKGVREGGEGGVDGSDGFLVFGGVLGEEVLGDEADAFQTDYAFLLGLVQAG